MSEDRLPAITELALATDGPRVSDLSFHLRLEIAKRICPEVFARIARLEEFIQKIASNHNGCEDGFYACPKSPDYFGRYDETPIEQRPCFCRANDAKALLLAQRKDGEAH